jgi:hypothetical protein
VRVIRNELLATRSEIRDVERRVDRMLEVCDKVLKGTPDADR